MKSLSLHEDELGRSVAIPPQANGQAPQHQHECGPREVVKIHAVGELRVPSLEDLFVELENGQVTMYLT